MGRPVVCAVAMPQLPRNSMGGEKLLRMMVSYDGQSGAVAPAAGTLLWAEEGIGSYERSIGGEHGTDVRVRVDRCLIGKRNIATGATGFERTGEGKDGAGLANVFDWSTVTRWLGLGLGSGLGLGLGLGLGFHVHPDALRG